ncbi:sugar ABC transporter substrate-binding protein [Pseudaeromonas paramecii]|uniref:Extracellular solute-binding protein n=1 Tax=Pseudaeromonas paramecii TaxID=2138166 RepID=A0ABP8QI83_9GAMM
MAQERLLLWHEFDGKGDTSIQVLEERCAAFSALGLGEVVPEVMNIRHLHERLAQIQAGGPAPDIAFVPADMLYLQEHALFSPVSPSDFDTPISEGHWQTMQLRQQQYGVPLLGGNHLVLFFNRQLLPEPPASWEALEALAPELQAKGITPMASDCCDAYWFIPFLTGHDGWVLNEGTPDLNNDANRSAMAFMERQVRQGLLANQQGSTALLDNFIAGHTAAIVCGEWIFNYLSQQMGERLGVAALPTVEGRAMTSMTSTIGLVYPNQGLSGPKRELILAFTRFMLSEASQRQWATQVQRWPVHEGVIEEQIRLGDGNRQAILALRQACRPMPRERIMFDVWFAMALGLRRLLNQECDVKEAAAFMQVCAQQQVGSQMAELL